MKKHLTIAFFLLLIIVLFACGHQHTWTEATCEEPKTCSVCGATEGEALGHTWIDATCEEPKTCSVCGATEGEALGHTWNDATCEKPKTCSVCGATEGEALGHTWIDATCQHPEQCALCGSTRNSTLGDHACNTWAEIVDPTCSEAGYKKGTCIYCGQEFTVVLEKLPHNFGEWKVIKEASCVEPGKQERSCTICGFEETEDIALLEHMLGEWETTKKATYNEAGLKEQKCIACKAVINSEEFSFADTIKDKVELKGDVDGITVTDAYVIYKSSWGYINGLAMIEIRNSSDSNIRVTKESIDLVDKEASLVGKISDYNINHAPAIIEPNQKGYVLAEVFGSKDEIDTRNGMDIRAIITVEKTTSTRSQWEFSNVKTKGNDPVTIGYIKNLGNETYDGYQIICVYHDKTGRVIGYTETYSNDEIAPDETVSFSTSNLYNKLIKSKDIVDVECIGVGYSN